MGDIGTIRSLIAKTGDLPCLALHPEQGSLSASTALIVQVPCCLLNRAFVRCHFAF